MKALTSKMQTELEVLDYVYGFRSKILFFVVNIF